MISNFAGAPPSQSLCSLVPDNARFPTQAQPQATHQLHRLRFLEPQAAISVERVTAIPVPLPLPGQLKLFPQRVLPRCGPLPPVPESPHSAGPGGSGDGGRASAARAGFINAIQVFPYTEGALYQVYAKPGQVTELSRCRRASSWSARGRSHPAIPPYAG